MLRHIGIFALTIAMTAAIGCNSGSRDSNKSSSTTAPATSSTTGGTTSGTTGGTNTGTAALDLANVALPAAPAAQAKLGADSVALVVNLASSGNAAVEVSDFTISSSGSVDESADIGELKVYGDDNKNGVVDQGEPVLATIAAPAFTSDDGSVQVAFANPITIQPGADLQLIVTADTTAATSAAQVGKIGKTVELSVAAAADLNATYGGSAVTPQGSFPITGGPVTLYLNDHLVISEIMPIGYPADEEFIELFNPTGATIDLSNYYLSDQSDSGGAAYYNLPTGSNFDSGSVSDFFVRFPPGASLAPGQVVTVALNGTTFETTYGQPADYAMRNPTGGAVQMLTHNGTAWVAVAIGTQVELYDVSGEGEVLVLFHWDGASDLVQDVDYVFFGAPNSFNFQWDKTGISIDGPDADTTPTQFQPETPVAQQSTVPYQTAPNNSIVRQDFSEGTETFNAGNGITGHDETSENAAGNWTAAPPTPGTP